MDINQLYSLWLENASADPDLKTELESIKGKEEEISDRFYRELEFGTGGLRGVIGAGTNRMNVYTVNKATQGLADYIKNHGGKSVAIKVRLFRPLRRRSFRGKQYKSTYLQRAYAYADALLGGALSEMRRGSYGNRQPQSRQIQRL